MNPEVQPIGDVNVTLLVYGNPCGVVELQGLVTSGAATMVKPAARRTSAATPGTRVKMSGLRIFGLSFAGTVAILGPRWVLKPGMPGVCTGTT